MSLVPNEYEAAREVLERGLKSVRLELEDAREALKVAVIDNGSLHARIGTLEAQLAELAEERPIAKAMATFNRGLIDIAHEQIAELLDQREGLVLAALRVLNAPAIHFAEVEAAFDALKAAVEKARRS